MINTDRIIPIEKVDYLSLISQVFAIASVTVEKLSGAGGNFTQDTNSKTVLCDEPVKTLNFGSSVTAATVYFVPDYNYEGFTQAGAAITTTGDVATDGVELYKAVLASGAVTITKVGL